MVHKLYENHERQVEREKEKKQARKTNKMNKNPPVRPHTNTADRQPKKRLLEQAKHIH